MPGCAVSGCLSYNRKTKGTDVKYYRFPKNEDLARQWLHACRREDKVNLQHARICSLHFEESSFEIPLKQKLLNYEPKNGRNLKVDAVPTKSLPQSCLKRKTTDNMRLDRCEKRRRKKEIHDIIASSSSTVQATSKTNSDEHVSKDSALFLLNETCDEWVLMCGRPELHDRYERRGSVKMHNTYKICAEHFLPTDFRNPRQHSQGLKPGSIPSQKLDYNRIQLNKRLNEACIPSQKLDCHLIELQNGGITVAIEGLPQQESIPNEEQCRTLNEVFETKFHKSKICGIEETVWKENPLFWRHRLNEEVIYSILSHDKEISLKPEPENKEVGETTSECALPTILGDAAIVKQVKLETGCDDSASGTELNCYLEDDFATVKCEAEDYKETMEADVPCHLEEVQDPLLDVSTVKFEQKEMNDDDCVT